ncbi:TerC family protein [Amorphus orientalis]|uniref:Tellurite resistance protein TerC n=1 Tax=Amorphus orientalis TaxID=649198 RepID=A0AAE4ASX1_9HYPH|nr:TerC family protein [Amorphus orientalis]MDQ0315718.1 tellurite resistance protein TerC [Amorphus orientalis]
MLSPADSVSVPPLFWVVFLSLVALILIVDLGVLHRRAHVVGMRESLLLASGYAGLAVLFGIGVWLILGIDAGAKFFTAYIVEQSLSFDNVFVMSVVFVYFGIPREHRHRVLFWGILGAMVFRAILIGTGAAVLHEFEWLLVFFAALLIFTGVKLLLHDEEESVDIANNRAFRWLSRRLPMTPRIHGPRFLVREPRADGRGTMLMATPLLFALIVIEVSDLIFAVDSIPAVLAISHDPFIVYTSNVFAILNLRALYFVIDALVARCSYLKPALSAVLIFIGGKILWDMFIGETEALVSLGVTVFLIGGAIILSFVFPKEATCTEEIGERMRTRDGTSYGHRDPIELDPDTQHPR